ncbi:unnamed protein product [Fraxinus pennsylvanica]|uniref:Transposase MuDR plant domain-containing protein n=1 Tax=Fraxinus pennsylvanica TaxID=56036 RepID=A0AAD1ZBX8_9LAMI|nr:unnamed protein product [Fraxinus pennsylvanica]
MAEEQPADIPFDEDPDLSDSDFNDWNNDVYDDDDILFDRNVTKGIEMDMIPVIEYEQAPKSDSSSHASSEELNFRSGSESKENNGQQKFPEYNAENGKRNPHLEVGLLFSSFEELKYVLRTYVVFNRVEPIFKRNDRDRVHCVCKDGCNWRLWASKVQGLLLLWSSLYKFANKVFGTKHGASVCSISSREFKACNGRISETRIRRAVH